MIFPVYLILGVLMLGVTSRSLLRRSDASGSTGSRNNFLNLATIAHCAIYLILTIYIIAFVPMPVFAFNDYLFADPLAIYEVLITSVIFLLAAVYGRGYILGLLKGGEIKAESLGLFYASFNLLLIVTVFCFFSNNMALFWILLELTTILSALLIVMLNIRDNINAALKYVFIASTAMLFSVIGLIILFALTKQGGGEGTLNWTELMEVASSLPPSMLTFAFAFAFIGFASKAGIAPFHTWLPQAYSKAPSMISAVLSAVVINGGIYGILRLYAVAYQTQATKEISVILIVFGVISIAVAAFSMLTRSNLKKLIGFSSVEHMGLVLIAIAMGTPVAIFWVLFHILAHALIKGLLFFSAGILNRQYISINMEDIENALQLQPLASWGIIIGSIAIIGIPPLPIFFSKLAILSQLGSYSWLVLVLVLLLLLVVASAFAFLLIRSFAKQTEAKLEKYSAHWTMKLPIIILILAIAVLSVFLSYGLSDMLTNMVSSLGF